MKYKYFNIKSLSIENKILISCLGIAVLSLVFFIINKNSKIIEPIPPFVEPEEQVTDALLATEFAVTDAEIATSAATTDTLVSVESTITQAEVAETAATTDAIMVADDAFAQEERVREANLTRAASFEESVGGKISDRVNRVANVVSTGADFALAQAQNIAENAKNTLTYYKQADWNSKAVGMFSNFWKVGFLGFLVASGVGAWAITNIKVLIYRITNFKSCFFWYFLEIIGWILYLPIQFFVWLFCLQEFEKDCWNSLDALDCHFYDYTGFYLFKHSDDVNEKCYSKVFTPFPKLSIPFNFDTIGNYMNNLDNITNNLTSEYGSPDEIMNDVNQSVEDAQKASEAAKAAETAAETAMAVQIGTEAAIAFLP